LKERLSGKKSLLTETVLNPWWIGFRGLVERKGDKQWFTKGLYTWQDATQSVLITELPVGTWTKDYKVFLDGLVQGVGTDAKEDGKPVLKHFDDLYNDVDVKFTLYLEAPYYAKAKGNPEEFEKRFHLTTSWKTTNMCAFDAEHNIIKYDTIGDLLEDYYQTRLGLYEKRKAHQISELNDRIEELSAKAKFIKGIVEGTIKIMNMEDSIVLASLKSHDLPPRSQPDKPDSLDAYEYLLRMRIDRIKKSSVIEVEKDLEITKHTLVTLVKTTVTQIWLTELEEFLEAWRIHYAKVLDVLNPVGGVQKTKKIVVKKK
jgi:DNA topoisomerase-2